MTTTETVYATPYEGKADSPWPPFELGWAEVARDDAAAKRRASMMGALPAYHYVDDALPEGLYRFFAFETPVGPRVGALKFVGAERAAELLKPPRMGQGPGSVEAWVDSQGSATGAVTLNGQAIPEDNSAISSSETNSGIQVTPVAYATVQAAASAMLAALQANGYRRLDQPIYAGYQLKVGGLTVDAFPGTNTMASLRATLSGMGVALPSSIPVYPWLATTASGATGQAAYDGVNAPTWAQWTGQGSAPAPAPGSSSTASVVGIGLATAALVTVAAVLVKSAGGLGAMYPG
jgi:hypothetical protein